MTDSISIIQKILYKGMIDRICSEGDTFTVHMTDDAVVLGERLRRFEKTDFLIERVYWEDKHLVLQLKDLQEGIP